MRGDEAERNEEVSSFPLSSRIKPRVRLVRSTMVCFSVAGMPAVPVARRVTRYTPKAYMSAQAFKYAAKGARFRTPSSPSGWTKHEGTGVLSATRGRPGVGRCHRATSLYLRKANLFDKHMFPAGACFHRTRLLRFLLPKLRVLTKLFSLFDAQSGTVSLRRSTMPNDG